MTLRHMKILVEVYRQNSVTKAAQALLETLKGFLPA